MCLIIDANLTHQILTQPPDDDFKPVLDWLTLPSQNGQLVTGGKAADELLKMGAPRRFIRALAQAGRLRLIPKASVYAEQAIVLATDLCKSDDPHIIALARVSGARVLCSYDKALHADFKNPNLVSKPRGKIYQNATPRHLLQHTAACRRYLTAIVSALLYQSSGVTSLRALCRLRSTSLRHSRLLRLKLCRPCRNL
jgi:hypothetical protein